MTYEETYALKCLLFQLLATNRLSVSEIMQKYGYLVNWAMKVLEIFKKALTVQNGHVYIQLMKQQVP